VSPVLPSIVHDSNPSLAASAAPNKSGEYVARLKHRDPQALSELYARYNSTLHSLVLRIVDNPAIAEDLVQEAFLRLWNSSECLSAQYRSIGPWLVTIARNCALDYRKSAASRLGRYEELLSCALTSSNFEEEVFASERADLLAHAYEQLPCEQREVVKLAYYEGLSHAEIAEKLNQPLGTIKGRLRLALSKLRSALREVAGS